MTMVWNKAGRAATARQPIVVAVGAAIALTAVATPILATETVGLTAVIVRTVTGTVEGDSRSLLPMVDVHHDEVIETEAKSATEIIFRDDTRVFLGAESRLTLDRFVFDPDPTRSKFVMTAVKGALRFVSGSLAKSSYEIRTPSATIGIRGTIFSLVAAASGATAVVLTCPSGFLWQPQLRKQWFARHSGGITVKGGAGESADLDECGSAIEVNADGTVAPPGPVPGWASGPLRQLDKSIASSSSSPGDGGGEDRERSPRSDDDDDDDGGGDGGGSIK